MDKENVIYVQMEYYSAIKWEIMPFATTWMGPEDYVK